MNKLEGMRCYLAGPIEFAAGHGMDWRHDMSKFLRMLNVVPIDPCKTIHEGQKTEIEHIETITKARQENDFETMSYLGKSIRCFDLRLVDLSDFIIAYVNQDVKMCGTWEEIFTANRQKKPILTIWEGGKNTASLWMFGTINHNHIFESIDEVKDHLLAINNGDPGVYKSDRWVFLREKGIIL